MLRGRADNAFLHVLHAGAAAINGDDQHVIFAPDSLQRLISTGSGRFIDRVNDIDVRVLLEKVFHRAASAFLIAIGQVATGNARIVFIPKPCLVLRIDAEAGGKALIAQNIDARLRCGEVKEGHMRVLDLIAKRCRRPFAHQFTGKEIVGGKGCIRRIGGFKRRVKRDDEHSRIARLLQRRHDALGVGSGDENALRAISNAGFNGCDLAFGIAVNLTRIGLEIDTKLLRLGDSAFLHLDEERIGIRLGDEARANIGGVGCTQWYGGSTQREGSNSRRQNCLLHGLLPD